MKEKELDELAKQLENSGRDKNMSYVFLKVREIINDVLCVDLSSVTLDSHISENLNADGFDVSNLIFEFDDEFNIEIPEHILCQYNFSSFSFNSSGNESLEPLACTVGELLDYMYKVIPKDWTLK